jgi:hypothetical protein
VVVAHQRDDRAPELWSRRRRSGVCAGHASPRSSPPIVDASRTNVGERRKASARAAVPPPSTVPEDQNSRPYKPTQHNLAQSRCPGTMGAFSLRAHVVPEAPESHGGQSGTRFSSLPGPAPPGHARRAPVNTRGAHQRTECTV